MSMTFSLTQLYCRMNFTQQTGAWFSPALHLSIANSISLVTAIVAFNSIDLDQKTLITFLAYYFIMAAMTVMFKYRKKLISPQTRQLLQLSFFLLGCVLIVSGVLGMLKGSFNMLLMFLLMVFLPGLATLRAGLHFNKSGE